MGRVWDGYGKGMGRVWDRYGTGMGQLRDGTGSSTIVSVPVPLRDLERPREARLGKGQVRARYGMGK